MKIATFFAGAGGLDRGFEDAGFDVVWANEYDKSIWATYRHNFPKTVLDTRSIVEVESSDVPDCDGIIGGPPCQSWSEAGALRGIEDKRGQLFFEYIRLLKAKRPLFFLVKKMFLGYFSIVIAALLSQFLKIFQNLATTSRMDYLMPMTLVYRKIESA